MLILTRNKGEHIVINGNIKVYYMESKTKNSIKIGIDAPKDVIVDRSEIDKKRTESKE